MRHMEQRALRAKYTPSPQLLAQEDEPLSPCLSGIVDTISPETILPMPSLKGKRVKPHCLTVGRKRYDPFIELDDEDSGISSRANSSSVASCGSGAQLLRMPRAKPHRGSGRKPCDLSSEFDDEDSQYESTISALQDSSDPLPLVATLSRSEITAELAKGARVLHEDNQGGRREAHILVVRHDGEASYYTIKFIDGTECETTRERLRPWSAKDGDSSSTSSTAEQRRRRDEAKRQSKERKSEKKNGDMHACVLVRVVTIRELMAVVLFVMIPLLIMHLAQEPNSAKPSPSLLLPPPNPVPPEPGVSPLLLLRKSYSPPLPPPVPSTHPALSPNIPLKNHPPPPHPSIPHPLPPLPNQPPLPPALVASPFLPYALAPLNTAAPPACKDAACLNRRFRRDPYAPWPTDGSLVDMGVLIHCVDGWEQRGKGEVMSASFIFADLHRVLGGKPKSWLFGGCDSGYTLKPGGATHILCGNGGDAGTGCNHERTWAKGNWRFGETIPQGLRIQADGALFAHGSPYYNEFVYVKDPASVEASFGTGDFGGFRVHFGSDWEEPFS